MVVLVLCYMKKKLIPKNGWFTCYAIFDLTEKSIQAYVTETTKFVGIFTTKKDASDMIKICKRTVYNHNFEIKKVKFSLVK